MAAISKRRTYLHLNCDRRSLHDFQVEAKKVHHKIHAQESGEQEGEEA